MTVRGDPSEVTVPSSWKDPSEPSTAPLTMDEESGSTLAHEELAGMGNSFEYHLVHVEKHKTWDLWQILC